MLTHTTGVQKCDQCDTELALEWYILEDHRAHKFKCNCCEKNIFYRFWFKNNFEHINKESTKRSSIWINVLKVLHRISHSILKIEQIIIIKYSYYFIQNIFNIYLRQSNLIDPKSKPKKWKPSEFILSWNNWILNISKK